MQKLPWLPRPLIVFAPIAGEITPCVQWHGQESSGDVTDEQFLFPLCGLNAQYIEVVRPDFWRVASIGNVVELVANELCSHPDFLLVCGVVARSQQGILLFPQVYENPDVHDELPRDDEDKEFQRLFRYYYLKGAEDIDAKVSEVISYCEQTLIAKRQGKEAALARESAYWAEPKSPCHSCRSRRYTGPAARVTDETVTWSCSCRQRWWCFNTYHNLWTTVDDKDTWDNILRGCREPVAIGFPARNVFPAH
ncbi:MAG: hypothetical protein A2675_01085 [Candidatus Yonathbacteria bacterium RIFCSPHIGHO2_01_FULL_51_10]|uniref:Uncharacterized protein n=1 Tax=Candidatus Yonathbacteria bacterium RIFCSPHIGHO2_01_FULL_51_10 TaxID=1802723 RepID=A0A1G2S4R7_9BACT|nr:MAG: hypothetical protein A2675_01085 [Candidatus Yonathbacteria bacterium RIFCSPHIGHO2_01_FULL_51_10]